VGRVGGDLGVGESDDRVPRGEEVLVAADVPGLRGRGAVVGEAVGLDDEVLVGPEEVRAVLAEEPLLREWPWQARVADESQESALEIRVGAGVVVEQAM
jgi:hypothetical protein